MEWKSDEQNLTQMAVKAVVENKFPTVGIPSSQGVPNPGLSVWLIALFARVSSDPIFIVSVIQWLNVLTLWGFFLFALFNFKGEERAFWLLGLALFSVSPLPVLYSRKIWQQCLIPPFTLALFIGHSHRIKNWGSFLWGLSGIMIAQIHMAGFFLVPSLLGATLYKEIRKTNKINTRALVFWSAGTLVGALGLIPWILSTHPQSGLREFGLTYLKQVFRFQFFSRWMLDVLGFGFDYYARPIFWKLIFENPLFGVAHLICLVVGIKSIFPAIKTRTHSVGLYSLAFFWLYGLCLTLLGLPIPPHYLILAYPFTHILFIRVVPGMWLRTSLILSQALITGTFLYFVHVNGGSPGEYQKTFSSQTHEQR
jgi:hypothetical protein